MTVEDISAALTPEAGSEAAPAHVDPAIVETNIPDDNAAMGDAYDRAISDTGRDEHGRFVSKNPAPEGGASPADGEGAGDADASSTVAQASPAPAHLPQAIKADWDKIPETARNAIVSHQAEMDRKFGEIGEQFGRMKTIAEPIQRAAQQFPEFRGMTPDQIAQGAVKLAAVQAQMEKGPDAALSAILEVAQTYNILPKLRAAMGGQAGESDGLITGLQQKISNLEAQLQKASNPDFIREQITETMTARETETAVQTFAAGKEYWADVEAKMPGYVAMARDDAAPGASPTDILNAAYDMAINAIPAVREKLRAAEAAKATATAADPKRTEQQRRAASINVKSTSSGERQLSEAEAMASAYDRAMAN